MFHCDVSCEQTTMMLTRRSRQAAIRRSDAHSEANSCRLSEVGQRRRVALRGPIALLIVAATAVPVEMRELGHATFDLQVYPLDFAANVIGYLPLGVALATLGTLRAVTAAFLLSMVAEICQLAMMHRDPSAADILANTVGAALGATVVTRWKVLPIELNLNRGTGLAAAIAACAIVLWAFLAADPINTRGLTTPGVLEGHWKFDEPDGLIAQDASGHGLNGRFQDKLKRVSGVLNGAVELDGSADSIDLDPSTTLRLVGSMTIAAWINPSRFPADDAAVVSGLSRNAGYQLDTTVDRGARTIGFKLTNAFRQLMARYGATALPLNAWHHIAGVYNAPARTLDVYLDGKLDNGDLVGVVTSRQDSSHAGISIGRRSDDVGFEFAGSIDDVHIYSLPLTGAEIDAVMRGASIGNSSETTTPPGALDRVRFSDDQDKIVPLRAAMLGVLVAIALLSLWPSVNRPVCVFASLVAGLLLLPPVFAYLPLFNLWLVPVVSFAGGTSVVLGTRDPPISASSLS